MLTTLGASLGASSRVNCPCEPLYTEQRAVTVQFDSLSWGEEKKKKNSVVRERSYREPLSNEAACVAAATSIKTFESHLMACLPYLATLSTIEAE